MDVNVQKGRSRDRSAIRSRGGPATFPLPSQSFPFLAKGSLVSAQGNTLTFTRSTTALDFGSNGLLQTYAINVPRFGYNQATLAARGLLIESAATQLVTPLASVRDMTNAAWVKVNMTAAKTATGADGVANSATTLTATAGTATTLQTLVAAATSRTYSALVKRRTGTGTIILKQGTATLDITALINSTTYTLVQLPDNELNVAFGFQINTNGDAIDVDYNQFEAGAIATSRIPDTGATRGADTASITLGSWYSSTAGTFYVEYEQPFSTGLTRYVLSTDDGSGGISNGVEIYASSSVTHFDVYSSTVQTANLSLASPVAGSVTKTAIALKANSAVAYQNGVAATINTPMTSMPVGSNILFVGSIAGGNQAGSYIRTINYYPNALNAATSQRLTL